MAFVHQCANSQPIATRVDGALYYVHSDHLGSTVAVSDAAGGAVGRMQYDPYGEVLTSTLPVTLTDRLFTGARFDGTIGLYQMGARWYDPALGRWLQADSIVPELGNPQALNRYAYVYNNPLRYTDPSGHYIFEDDPGKPYFPPPLPPNPLTNEQWEISRAAAAAFELPVELVAGTVAVEIVDDTDLKDAPLDFLFQEVPLGFHYTQPESSWARVIADLFLEGYEHYFGLLGGRGPGNGVANLHILTAKVVEEYFATHYPDQHLLDPPPDIYIRSAILLPDEGNIYYAAAILRMIADCRTGVRGPHTDDLSDLDMQMIYGRFRCYCWESWSDFAASTEPVKYDYDSEGQLKLIYDSRGQVLAPYLELYRAK